MKLPWFKSISLCAIVIEIGWGAASWAGPGQEPCDQIKSACESAGFVEGGAKEGKGLTWDCINPILQGKPQPKQASKPLPKIAPQIVAACKANNPKFGQLPGVAATPPADSRATARQTPTPTPSPTGSQNKVSNLLPPQIAAAPPGPGRPEPKGLYILTRYSNNPNPDGSEELPPNLVAGYPDTTLSTKTAPSFNATSTSGEPVISGIAIYLALEGLLPDPLPPSSVGGTWDQLFSPTDPHSIIRSLNWKSLDRMVALALQNNKLYSIAIVVGFENLLSQRDAYLSQLKGRQVNAPSFVQSLPSWFEQKCNPNWTPDQGYYPWPNTGATSPWNKASCAPTFNIIYHSIEKCLSWKIPLPWNPNVQLMWGALANALSTHLRTSCYKGGASLVSCNSGDPTSVYHQLTLVHLSGLSGFDEELSLPNPASGAPISASPPKNTCPDGRSYTLIIPRRPEAKRLL
jgi:hypothetical protein